ncbi:MAG: hypothetical protein Q9Q40_15625 [Acidobacteriota bacterium]|nr:hypothetical protein [Acidobacteriota bacterium]
MPLDASRACADQFVFRVSARTAARPSTTTARRCSSRVVKKIKKSSWPKIVENFSGTNCHHRIAYCLSTGRVEKSFLHAVWDFEKTGPVHTVACVWLFVVAWWLKISGALCAAKKMISQNSFCGDYNYAGTNADAI